MSGSVVVDASLAVKWLVEEDDSDKAHAVLQSWVAQDIARGHAHLVRKLLHGEPPPPGRSPELGLGPIRGRSGSDRLGPYLQGLPRA